MKVVLPKGYVCLDGKHINDKNEFQIDNLEIVKNSEFPPVLKLTTESKEIYLCTILSEKDLCFRLAYYRRLYANLIKFDISLYEGSYYDVEETISNLLENGNHLQWINKEDEKEIASKIGAISSWKSFGTDRLGVERFYCPRTKKVESNYSCNCSECPFKSTNIVLNSVIKGCVGFLDNLTYESIMNAEKHEYSDVKDPSYLEYNSRLIDGYKWLKLGFLAKSYPEISYTFIKCKETDKIYFVNLRDFEKSSYYGLEILSDGRIIHEAKSLLFITQGKLLRIYESNSFKVNQEYIDALKSAK